MTIKYNQVILMFLFRKNETRQVSHFAFSSWPDYGKFISFGFFRQNRSLATLGTSGCTRREIIQ